MPTRKHTHLDTVNSLPQTLHLPIDAGSLLHQIAQTPLHARNIAAEMLHLSSRLPPPVANCLQHRLQLLHLRHLLAVALNLGERLLEPLVLAVQTLQSAAQRSNLPLRFLHG